MSQLEVGDGSATAPKSLFIFVGDVSADRHTARLLSQLRKVAPQLKVWGVGGQSMAAQGADLLYECESFSTVGIIEVIRFLPFLNKLTKQMLSEIDKRRPDAVLLVDFAGFNLNLAGALRKAHPQMPIVYFISPQIWGSRPWRINAIARTISKMLVIFPFEQAIYEQKGVNAAFVGHPLKQALASSVKFKSRAEFCRQYNLDPERPVIGIFPGSRRQEIKDLMPVLLQSITWLLQERPDLQFVISRANNILAEAIDEVLDKTGNRRLVGNSLKLANPEDGYDLMSSADLLWAKSGTTTLEAALLAKPMLIFYRANWLSYLLFLLFKRVHKVSWPNILAGKTLVPELIQLDCRAELFVRYTRDYLEVPALRQEIANELSTISGRLGDGDFAANAASQVLSTLGISQ